MAYLDETGLTYYDTQIKAYIASSTVDKQPFIITATVDDAFVPNLLNVVSTPASIDASLEDIISAYRSKRPMMVVISGGADGALTGTVLTNTLYTMSSDVDGTFTFKLENPYSGYFLTCTITVFEGTLSAGMQSSPYKPTVISEYTSNDWKVRKWSNGECELWLNKSYTTAVNAAWGSLYISQLSTTIAFPVTFAAVPFVQATAYREDGDAGSFFMIPNGSSYGTTTTELGNYDFVSATSVASGIRRVSYYVKGILV